MKLQRLLLIVLGPVGTALFAAAGEPPVHARASAVILKAERPPVIDGALNEPCWQEAGRVRVDYLNSKQGVLSAEPRAVEVGWQENGEQCRSYHGQDQVE